MDGFTVNDEDLFFPEDDEELLRYVHTRVAIAPIRRPDQDESEENTDEST